MHPQQRGKGRSSADTMRRVLGSSVRSIDEGRGARRHVAGSGGEGERRAPPSLSETTPPRLPPPDVSRGLLTPLPAAHTAPLLTFRAPGSQEEHAGALSDPRDRAPRSFRQDSLQTRLAGPGTTSCVGRPFFRRTPPLPHKPLQHNVGLYAGGEARGDERRAGHDARRRLQRAEAGTERSHNGEIGRTASRQAHPPARTQRVAARERAGDRVRKGLASRPRAPPGLSHCLVPTCVGPDGSLRVAKVDPAVVVARSTGGGADPAAWVPP